MTALALTALLGLACQAAMDPAAAQQRGRELMAAGEPAKALPFLEAAVKARPDAAEARLELANAHLAVAEAMSPDGDRAAIQRHLEAAATQYRRVQSLSPDMADLASLRLITIYDRRHLNRPSDAEPHVRAQLAKNPGSPVYPVLLATLLIDLGRYTQAATVLAEARTRVEPDSRLLLAVTTADLVLETPAMAPGDQRRLLQGVVELADQAIASKTTEMRDALQVRSVALLLQAERTATTDAERADLEAQGDAAFGAFLAYGRETRAADPAVAARRAREEALSASVEGIEAHLKAGRTTEASAALAAATESHGTDADFWAQLASVYVGAGDWARAVQAIVTAATRDPGNPERHHAVATYRWEIAYRDKTLTDAAKREHIAAGLAATDKALLLKPDYAEAVVYRSILLTLQAGMEKDPARREALELEAAAARTRGQALMAARNKE